MPVLDLVSISLLQVPIAFPPVVAGTLSSTGSTYTSVSLAETTITGGTGTYSSQLQRAPDVAGAPGTWADLPGQVVAGPTPSWTDSSVTYSTTYWYRSVTTDTDSPPNERTSNEVSVTTPTPPPVVPGTLTATAAYANVVAIQESTITGGVPGYSTQFYRADDILGSPGTYAPIGSPHGGAIPNLTDTTVSGSTSYWYYSTTTDSLGQAADATAIKVTTSSSPAPTGTTIPEMPINSETINGPLIGPTFGLGRIGPPRRRNRG